MKKVVQVVTQMEAGGAQRVAMSLSAELSARGYEDEVWFLYLKRPAFVTEKRVRCLLSHPPRHIWDYLRIVCRLFAMLLRERPDVLIAHTHYSNILALPIGRLLLLRTLIAVQHNPLETYPRAARIVDAWVGAAGAYSVNVTVSSAVRESMRDRSAAYLRRVRTICNGVQTSVPKELVDGVRSAVQVPEQLSLLVNIGRLAEQKNQTLLIRMMSKLPNCFLLIVGDGELREKLRREAAESPAADRIRFLGERPSDEALAAAAAADVFVFPSLFEAMPLALIEAMALGAAVVASDIPATQEFVGVGDFAAGVLVDSNDPDRFADAVRQLLSDREYADRLRSNARRRAAPYTVGRMADNYIACWTGAGDGIPIGA